MGFLVDFEFYMEVFGSGRCPIGLVTPLRFKWFDSQPKQSNMDLIWADFHEFGDFHKSCGGFLTRYLPCVRPGCFQMCIFKVFGRNQKDARRKVMQIRGGFTSRSSLFDLFVPL